MKFWTNSRREWLMIGILIGVVLAVGAYMLASVLA